MLRSLKDLEKYTLNAVDGDIGNVANFLLDDQHWTIRYLVADTGGFFGERKVLISPISLRQADWSTRRLQVALTKDQVKKSPGIDTDKPVSRQQELEYHRYYGYPRYWAYAGRWGMGAFPGLLADPQKVDVPNDEANGTNDSIDTDDVHLRSASELRGYYIHGSDESIGHIEDFIVDDETWQVCYLVVDTSNWWMGKKVLVAPHWASKVNWAQHQIEIDLSRDTIKNGPEWDPDAAVNREYETRLYDYYGRPAYWK